MPVLVFIAYAHQDELLKNELLRHLSPLRRASIISAWHDRRIPAGKDWEHEIDEQLNTADLILPLISADFINSEYCYGIELRQALERHQRGDARVVPIILRPCLWQRLPIANLQALPQDAVPITKWSHADDAYAAIAKSIDEIATELDATGARSPASRSERAAKSGSSGTLPDSPDDTMGATRDLPPPDRPRVCIAAWSEIPNEHPIGLRAGQTGFQLANDGGTAYEISIDQFTIAPSKTANGESVPRIPAHAHAFALVWQDGFSHLAIATGKWDLLGAMREAAGEPWGLYGGPDYTIMVSVTYRDAAGTWWYRSTTPLTYIRSQNRLATGTPQHHTYARSKKALTTDNDLLPVLAFRAWHAATDLGRPRMDDDHYVPSFISVKNTQTAIPITAEHVTAELQYRNAAGKEYGLDHAPWYITNGQNDPNAHWADAAKIEASATASFALFVTDTNGELWIYRDPYYRVGKLDYGRWEVTITVTSTTTAGFTGTLAFTHTKHDGLRANDPAFIFNRVMTVRS